MFRNFWASSQMLVYSHSVRRAGRPS